MSDPKQYCFHVSRGSGESDHGNKRFSPYFHLLKTRLLEFRREPAGVFWVFGFPLVLALVLGVAFHEKRTDIVNVALVQSGSEGILDGLRSSLVDPGIHVATCDPARARSGFRFGKYDLIVEAQGSGRVQYEYDPSRPGSILALAKIDGALQAAAGRKDPIFASSIAVTEPGSRYIDFLIPGLLGLNLMNSGMWGVGFALVEMRQRRLLKRLAATPMRRSDFLLALASSRILVMIVEITVLLSFGVFAFHMPVLGSIVSTLTICLVGALSFSAIGLLIACRTGKVETANGLTNLVVLPMSILSGVFFSHDRLPAAFQPIIRLLPLTALNDALRSVVLQGSPLISQWEPLLVLVIWTAFSFSAALRWFNWTS